MIFTLPFEQKGNFTALFKELESDKDLKITLNINSLEDAFVNIGMDEDRFLAKLRNSKEKLRESHH